MANMDHPRQSFKSWAISEGLESSSSIEDLRSRKIAIDAEDYLFGIISLQPSHEPLLPALGGLPLRLASRVMTDIQNFKDAGIEVEFVFNGLELACRDRASMLADSRKATKILDQAWKDYDDSQGELAVSNFAKACTYRLYHVTRSLFFTLHRLDVAVLVAPYSAAAQIVRFLDDEHADAALGSASCLVFGADKVITSFDWESKTFNWVELQDCLTKTMLTREHFLDLLLLSGSSILPILPDVDSDTPGSKIPAVRTSMARVNNNAYALVARDSAYELLFHKARYAVKHAVVITNDGKLQPNNWAMGPQDTHEFVGQRLPEEIYFYLSRGVIGPRVLDWRTRQEVLELPPLDGGSSQAYRDLVQEKLRPYRAQALALITQSLHRYYQNTDMTLVCWFNVDKSTALGVSDSIPAAKQADSWNVKLNSLPLDTKSITAIDAEERPFFYATALLSEEGLPQLTLTNDKKFTSGDTIKYVMEAHINTTWRFLAGRNYLGPSDHKLTAWGKALKVSLDRAQELGISTAQSEEAIFTAFELIRLDILNSKQLFNQPPYSGAPFRGSDKDKANTMLISRVACLSNFTHAEIGYTGPLSRHLLAYGQVVSAVRESLRDLVETHACNLMLGGAVTREMSPRNYSTLAERLPFREEPNLGLAIVVKSYLDELCNDPAKRQDIGKWFNHALDIPGDLERMWKIWDAVVTGVKAADGKVIGSETKKEFESADAWLQDLLKSVADDSTVSSN